MQISFHISPLGKNAFCYPWKNSLLPPLEQILPTLMIAIKQIVNLSNIFIDFLFRTNPS